MIHKIGSVLIVCGVVGCVPGQPSAMPAPSPPCRVATERVNFGSIQPTAMLLAHVSDALVTGAAVGPSADASTAAVDSLRSALLSLTMYPPLRSDALAGRAARRFLATGGKPMELVWAAENAPTIDRTLEILGTIPDSAVHDDTLFASLRCDAKTYLRAYDAGSLGTIESSLGGIAVVFQTILDEIARILGRSE